MNRLLLMTTVALALIAMAPVSGKASPADSFDQGNAAYEAGEFQRAYDLYQTIITEGDIAPDLFSNLGNASYRLEQDGEAALWYRRALALDPLHAEARHNLRVIEEKTGFIKSEPNSIQRFLDRFSSAQLVILLSLSFWGLVLSVLAWWVFRGPSPRRRGGWGLVATRVLSLLLLTFSVVALVLQKQDRSVETEAVVLAEDTVARTSPYEDAKDVIALPPGTAVTRLEERGPWAYVGIGDDIRGWLRTNELKPLWPYESSILD
jgi:tetratricopeptide (TPR) repeat protein